METSENLVIHNEPNASTAQSLNSLKIEHRTRQESGYPGSTGSCGAVLNTSENRVEDTRTSGNKGLNEFV
jgi:hypothetical protein